MIRPDALATLYVFHPLVKLRGKTERLPILMYHSVSDVEESTHPYFRTATAPAAFAKQMEYLSQNGYSTISLGQAAGLLQNQEDVTGRPVVITFDDGYRDFYTHAFPILERYAFSAAVFLPTAYIGSVPQEFKGTYCLNWNEVRQLQKAGIEFGSHTVTHPQLKSLSAPQVRNELVESKLEIENQIGCAVSSFAYPYAFPEADPVFRAMLREALTEAGYETGVSTIIGTAGKAGDPLFMPRLPVNSLDDQPLFQAKLEGGYDWLHGAQYMRKSVKRLLGKASTETESQERRFAK